MSEREISIVHVFPSFAMGGQQRRLAVLIDKLGDGFFHKIYALDGDLGAKDFLASKSNFEVEPFAVQKTSGLSIENLKSLSRLLTRSDADLLCTYNWGALEAAAANKVGPRLRHLHFEDGFGPDEGPDRQLFRRCAVRKTLLSSGTVVVPSAQLQSIARKNWRLPERAIVYCANGVDLQRFSARTSYRDEKNATIGYIGALRAEKNLARLIRCFERIPFGLEAQLVIYGDGPEAEKLANIAARSAASNRIFFKGPTAFPERALAEFDIFALSSDTEQAPFSLMEAMASGLPIVATAVGDIKSMVSEENSAYVSSVSEENLFSHNLQTLIESPEWRSRLGSANRRRASSLFDQAAMIERYRALFLGAVDQP